jgi:hypothetical protein
MNTILKQKVFYLFFVVARHDAALSASLIGLLCEDQHQCPIFSWFSEKKLLKNLRATESTLLLCRTNCQTSCPLPPDTS